MERGHPVLCAVQQTLSRAVPSAHDTLLTVERERNGRDKQI